MARQSIGRNGRKDIGSETVGIVTSPPATGSSTTPSSTPDWWEGRCIDLRQTGTCTSYVSRIACSYAPVGVLTPTAPIRMHRGNTGRSRAFLLREGTHQGVSLVLVEAHLSRDNGREARMRDAVAACSLPRPSEESCLPTPLRTASLPRTRSLTLRPREPPAVHRPTPSSRSSTLTLPQVPKRAIVARKAQAQRSRMASLKSFHVLGDRPASSSGTTAGWLVSGSAAWLCRPLPKTSGL